MQAPSASAEQAWIVGSAGEERLEHLTAAELDAVRDALEKLAEPGRSRGLRSLARGDYGLCRTCGDELDAAWLLSRPDRQLCPVCSDDLAARRRGQRLGVCGVKPR